MVKLTILYPCQAGGAFDMTYYRETHLPMTRRLLGDALKSLTVEEGVTGGALPAPNAVVCHLTFESEEAMQAALAAHTPALAADIPNYTNVQAVFQVSRVVEA